MKCPLPKNNQGQKFNSEKVGQVGEVWKSAPPPPKDLLSDMEDQWTVGIVTLFLFSLG